MELRDPKRMLHRYTPTSNATYRETLDEELKQDGLTNVVHHAPGSEQNSHQVLARATAARVVRPRLQK